jgi:hypothetical protein
MKVYLLLPKNTQFCANKMNFKVKGIARTYSGRSSLRRGLVRVFVLRVSGSGEAVWISPLYVVRSTNDPSKLMRVVFMETDKVDFEDDILGSSEIFYSDMYFCSLQRDWRAHSLDVPDTQVVPHGPHPTVALPIGSTPHLFMQTGKMGYSSSPSREVPPQSSLPRGEVSSSLTLLIPRPGELSPLSKSLPSPQDDKQGFQKPPPSSMSSKAKSRCNRSRKDNCKMVVEEDVKLDSIPELLGKAAAGRFLGKTVRPLGEVGSTITGSRSLDIGQNFT